MKSNSFFFQCDRLAVPHYINLMNFLWVGLIVALLSFYWAVFLFSNCIWQFSKVQDISAEIWDSVLCGHRPRRVTDWWDSESLKGLYEAENVINTTKSVEEGLKGYHR